MQLVATKSSNGGEEEGALVVANESIVAAVDSGSGGEIDEWADDDGEGSLWPEDNGQGAWPEESGEWSEGELAANQQVVRTV